MKTSNDNDAIAKRNTTNTAPRHATTTAISLGAEITTEKCPTLAYVRHKQKHFSNFPTNSTRLSYIFCVYAIARCVSLATAEWVVCRLYSFFCSVFLCVYSAVVVSIFGFSDFQLWWCFCVFRLLVNAPKNRRIYYRLGNIVCILHSWHKHTSNTHNVVSMSTLSLCVRCE